MPKRLPEPYALSLDRNGPMYPSHCGDNASSGSHKGFLHSLFPFSFPCTASSLDMGKAQHNFLLYQVPRLATSKEHQWPFDNLYGWNCTDVSQIYVSLSHVKERNHQPQGRGFCFPKSYNTNTSPLEPLTMYPYLISFRVSPFHIQ